MSTHSPIHSSSNSRSIAQHYGLIVHQDSGQERILAKYIGLLLNYQYGLPVWTARDVNQGLLDRNKGLRCTFVIQDRALRTRTTLMSLSQRGTVPLFIILPSAALTNQQDLCRGIPNVFPHSWEAVIGREKPGLEHVVRSGLADAGVSGK